MFSVWIQEWKQGNDYAKTQRRNRSLNLQRDTRTRHATGCHIRSFLCVCEKGQQRVGRGDMTEAIYISNRLHVGIPQRKNAEKIDIGEKTV